MRRLNAGSIRILLVGFCLLLPVFGCTVAVQPKPAPASYAGGFSLFLQPLPQEVHRLTFSIGKLLALRADGAELPLPLKSSRITAEQIGTQKKLAGLTLPPGRYLGVALEIDAAELTGEEGPVNLLPPEERLVVELPFIIREKQAETLFLSLSAERLVTDGAFFTPRFSLWKPERQLTNLKGFVSNSDSQNLTVFNKRSAQVVGHIRVGKKPMGLVLDQQRNWLYVALAGENAIAVIEVSNNSILGRVPLRFGDEPTELALSSDGRVLLALNRGSGSVSIIDTASLFEVGRVRLRSQGDGIFLGRGESQAFVTHSGSSTLSVLDPQVQVLRGTVALENAALDGTSSSDGRTLYLINDFSAELAVLASTSFNQREKIYIGNGALSIRLDSATGLLYIGKQDGEVAVVDPRSLMAIDSYRLAGPVRDLTIDREENALFAVLPESGQLVKVDLVSKRELGRLQLEPGSRDVVVMGER